MTLCINLIDADGAVRLLYAIDGQTVMEAAVAEQVSGILAKCGGSCACGTCHVYVSEAWLARIPAPSEEEEAMLDYVADTRPNSRLSCQIRMHDTLNGLEAAVPIGSD